MSIGMFIGLFLETVKHTETTPPWILATGVWNDVGLWDDTDVWID